MKLKWSGFTEGSPTIGVIFLYLLDTIDPSVKWSGFTEG